MGCFFYSHNIPSLILQKVSKNEKRNNGNVDMKAFKEAVKTGAYFLCSAAELERQAEKISLSTLEKSLLEGNLVKKFSKDPRGPTFLIESIKRGKTLHIICAFEKKQSLRILAIYHPAHPKWFFPPKKT
jgi:hypothetical protein